MAHQSHFERRRGDLLISTDPARVDVDVVHGFLSTCYWSPGIPRPLVERAIAHSLCFGLYRTHDAASVQVGFARVITDRATFAYLCDVFVLESERGRGIGVWLMETLLTHPDLQGLRRFCLLTRDAHGLYERFGFKPMPDPSRFMERWDPDGYTRQSAGQNPANGAARGE